MQRFDSFPDEPLAKEDSKIRSIGPRRSFKHKPETQRLYTKISKRGLAASSISELQRVLTRDQLLQCAYAYINNGIVRTVVDKSVFFIQGDRTNFIIEPNEEITEGATDQEIRQIEDNITNSEDIKNLRRKLVRINKRVKLHDRIDKLLTSTFLFGRNGLEIIRNTTDEEWPIYGEPLALRHLNSIRLVDVQMDDRTSVFQGFFEDTGSAAAATRFIKSNNLIPAFYDDNNLLDNTYYSGLSAIWPILSVSQADDVINDEDIPEAVKNLASAIMLVYAGTNSQSKIDQIKEELQDKTALVHGLAEMRAEVHNMAGNILQLPDIRNANAKYICMCLSLPLFLLFEDTANFATANQVMQVYKEGMLKRHRTWLQGILEDYWYDPILADHLGIDIKDVISADIKIKAIFNDINFETRKDVVEADKLLVDMSVYKPADVAKDIDNKDVQRRLEQEEVDKEILKRDETIQKQQDMITLMRMQTLNQNVLPLPPKQQEQDSAHL